MHARNFDRATIEDLDLMFQQAPHARTHSVSKVEIVQALAPRIYEMREKKDYSWEQICLMVNERNPELHLSVGQLRTYLSRGKSAKTKKARTTPKPANGAVTPSVHALLVAVTPATQSPGSTTPRQLAVDEDAWEVPAEEADKALALLDAAAPTPATPVAKPEPKTTPPVTPTDRPKVDRASEDPYRNRSGFVIRPDTPNL